MTKETADPKPIDNWQGTVEWVEEDQGVFISDLYFPSEANAIDYVEEVDDGKLSAHHAFWQYPHNTQLHRTITEMIYVPNTVYDGSYLLNIQIASFESDASPSKPLLFQLNVAL